MLLIVNAAYEVDAAFGLLVDVLAVTGGRMSQAARLTSCVNEYPSGANVSRLSKRCPTRSFKSKGETPRGPEWKWYKIRKPFMRAVGREKRQ